MNVIQVVPDYGLGGIQKGGCVVALGLVKAGHRVGVIGFGDGPRRAGLEAAGITCFVFGRDDLTSIVGAISRLKADIVHIHAAGYEHALIDKLNGAVSLVVTPVFGRVPPKDIAGKIHLCCVGEFVAWRMWNWLGRPRHGIFSAPITPIEKEFYHKAANPAVRTKLGIPASHLVVGRIGRDDMLKWHRDTFDIVDGILGSHSNVTWLSVGMPSGLGAAKLREKWGNRFINNAQTADFSELLGYLGNMDIHVFASRYGECFSASIAEGMASGVPCIALIRSLGDSGEVEQIVPGETGQLAASKQGVIEAITELIQSPSKLAAMKTACKRKAFDEWDSEVVAARLTEFYLKIKTSGTGVISAEKMEEFGKAYERRSRSARGKNLKYEFEQIVGRTIYRSSTGFRAGRFLVGCLRKLRKRLK